MENTMSGYLSDEYGDYIQNHYGNCSVYDPKKKGSCPCLTSGWRGRFCENWVPVKEQKFAEMIERLKTDERYRK